jgi:hypothetical protein
MTNHDKFSSKYAGRTITIRVTVKRDFYTVHDDIVTLVSQEGVPITDANGRKRSALVEASGLAITSPQPRRSPN